MEPKSQKYLLALARQTIVDYFEAGEKIKIDEDNLPEKTLSKKRATFVTLTKNGQLRGCVGSLLPKKKLYEDVINNSLMAAFGDNRFPAVEKHEIADIKIEISILSLTKPYHHESLNDLFDKIIPHEHGIVLQKDYFQATFLPQVWEDIPDKEQFLSALSQKAGLAADAWRDQDCEIFYYTVEKFSE